MGEFSYNLGIGKCSRIMTKILDRRQFDSNWEKTLQIYYR